jgi:hypothetical protein
MKNIKGIDRVDVSLNKGLATMTFTPDNTVTMKQLQQAIASNGFTTKTSAVTVRGVLRTTAGKLQLTVSGSNESFDLLPEEGAAKPGLSDGRMPDGKMVEIDGIVPEPAKDKPSSVIRYRTITELK